MANGLLETSQLLTRQSTFLAETALTQFYKTYPESRGTTDPVWHEKSLKDMRYHILYLAEALGAGSPLLFIQYSIWVRDTLAGLGLPIKDIRASFQALNECIAEAYPAIKNEVTDLLTQGIEKFSEKPVIHEPSYLHPEMPFSALATRYLKALLAGDRAEAARLVLEEFQSGGSIVDIYLKVFQPVLREVGRMWQAKQATIAMEHYCTAATQLIMAQFYPYFMHTAKNGKVLVATCIGGEMHEIGMRMVADIFEINHWDTFYLGANTPLQSIIDTLVTRKAHVLGISVTMTYHISEARRLITEVRSHPQCQRVKILVGGYPFNLVPDLWKEIGADGFGTDAADAVTVANHLFEVQE